MPWQETNPMNERLRFIAEYNDLAQDESFTELCERFGISRKTGYKWLQRYQEQGAQGLMQRAPVAHQCAWAIGAEVVDRIIQARKEHPRWGPKKLRALLQEQQPPVGVVPACSTIGEILKRHGLIRPRRRRVSAPRLPSELGIVQQPNDLWCADFKGDLRLGDGTVCKPLTVTDQLSRYLLKSEALVQTGAKQVQPHFEQAFKEYGLPLRIRTDNGPPFASLGPGGLTELSVWWIKLGIVPERIEPAKPQQNGRHERMHRTMKAEVGSPPGATLMEQQRMLDQFRRQYNEERPHEALGQTVPAKHYGVSPRQMPKELLVPEYPDQETRWVRPDGSIKWRGHLVRVGPCLAKEPVGLEQISPVHWRVHYGPVCLGVLDEREEQPRLGTWAGGSAESQEEQEPTSEQA